MNIGIVLYPTYGGSGVVATELGKGLAQRGHNVHFVSYARPMRLDEFHERISFHEVSFSAYPLFEYPPYDLALASHLVDIIKFHKLDLLHVHYAIPHATSAYLAKQILGETGQHIPVITTLHGTDITIVGSDPSYAPVVTFSINKSDGVTAVSEYLRNETCNRFDIENEIEVIPNFIDLERFKRSEKSHFKKALCPNGEKVLVHVSNFREVKRVSDTVELFDKVLKSGIEAHLLLVGDGPDRQKVENRCRELGICEHVRFLGKQEKIEDILSIADLFLIPSGSETFGLAALEAMSCSVPVISSNIGGLPELNIHGETGYLCDLGDTDAMGDYAISILSDDELQQKLSRNARKRAEVFEQSLVIDHYESYYRKVMKRMEETQGSPTVK
ncbi:N-acetyl-alpha-D-glucosaminyl L-malate synthase BshA [Natronogracilivirga saccharolytica]|uniref:N-acetyl-alpha-D-glucosaminyl L-malate synthase BshA n=1 Tax=Natronogracilivirga saccharolytica TaxID=2812953 RepID=A0A8J7RP30_9BACT|nr:N-acetyl-alpha-D-glucosaminyl L-malate synthase BshA [Natronogracilivirga saccharolytica]MBP3193578.1 N-acetyl-alpha-D-glucosaminyl L-malate synthase BshA [Natronogracilivirga saccharolytica]